MPASPLKTLLAWYQNLPEPIALEIAQRITMFEGGNMYEVSREKCVAWLSPDTIVPPAIVGRVISACAYIDFEMEEKGTAKYWDDQHEENLKLVDSDMHPEARKIINDSLGDFEKNKRTWEEASLEWWKLRASELHNDTIRPWFAGEMEGFFDILDSMSGDDEEQTP